MAHANISIFVPHLGCPNQCSFCNQHHISGCADLPDAHSVAAAVKTATASKNYNSNNTEIAFFGGSFTAIDRDYMAELLSAASVFVRSGDVSGIRISTRPDAIDDDVLVTLKQYGVTSIELGAQSMDDTVLSLNRRGHSSDDVVKASALIKKHGFSLGLQMMTGLYGDSDEKTVQTAQKIIELKPDTVRIYPTIVFKDTPLGELYKKGEYTPQTLESAVDLAARLLIMFKNAGINVIRTGLHSVDMNTYIAGPWHPAFKEMCDARIYLGSALSRLEEKGDYTIFVGRSFVSRMVGQKRQNIEFLKEKGFNCKVRSDDNLEEYEIKILRM